MSGSGEIVQEGTGLSPGKRIALLGLAAVLYVLSFPLSPAWPLIFVAMAPALIATRGLDPGRAGKIGFGFGFAVSALGLTWFWNIFSVGAISLWAILAAWLGVFFAARAVLERRLGARWAFWGTVILWTAVEFFRAECYYLRCTFLCLGHALAVESCPLKLGARWIGAYGLGACIMALNVAISCVISPARLSRRYGLVTAAGVIVGLAALTGVTGFLARCDDESPSMRVALVQNETSVLRDNIRLSREAVWAKPQWILWPEISLLSDVKADPRARNAVENLAREMNAFIGVGAKLTHPTVPNDFWNAYVLFSPAGAVVGEHHKIQPVQFMKDGVPGKKYGVLATDSGRIGVALCYDADFTWICRNLAAKGAHVLVVPTYDPVFWGKRMPWQHVSASLLRAIENGRYLLRPASSGPSLIIDPAGCIRARLDDADPGVVTGEARLLSGRTFHNRFGWLLPYAAQAAAVCLLVCAFVRAKSEAPQRIPENERAEA